MSQQQKEVPGIPGVFVRVMSAAELFAIQDAKERGEQTGSQGERAFGLALMASCTVNEDGTQKWSSQDEMLKIPAPKFLKMMEPICTAAMAINGMDDDDEDDPGND